ncbi:MAG: hypothetical protein KGJ98_13660 [Chloroflexota bacterium]|nr:hypothetical protein [Chloroflexota bacterium]
MPLIRVRKQGNSMVVTLSQDVLEGARLSDGDLVQERVDGNGRVVIEAVSVKPRVSPRMAAAIRGAVQKERRVLKRLAERDRG